MAVVQDFVNVSITLQTSTAPTVSFDQMFLVDSTDVPLDLRFRDTTKTGYTTDLTSTENTYKYAAAFWSQKRTADTLRLGRWASAATAPYFVCGDHETDYTVWKLVSDGSFTVKDNDSNEDDITACDFTGITDLNGILTVLNAKLAAIGAPNITGLDSALFSFDIESRLILTHSVTGAAAKTLTIISDTTGTDLSPAAYFDAGLTGTDGLTVAGIDAEEPTAAITAIRAKTSGDNWYDCCVRGESTAQQQTLAAQFEALQKQLTLVSTESGAKSAGSTSDVPYLLNALGYDRTMIMYTEHSITATGGWCDAAIQGAVLPAEQGTTAWSNEVVSGVFESGLSGGSPIPLTAGERTALEDKNCNYFVTIGNDTFMTPGLNCSGEEKRTIIGADWLETSIEGEIFSYDLNQPLPAFDAKTLAAYEKYIRRYLKEAKDRGIIVDTPDRPITVTMPDADDFTAAQRASHTMTLSNVFSAYINSVVNNVAITGEFRI
jgi:hypothetical protein